jgi:hypothetical protein
MKFLCVCYYDATAFAGFNDADFKKIGEICAPHDKEFKPSGKVKLIGSLVLPNQFRTMRANANGVTVTDGLILKHQNHIEADILRFESK